MTFEFDTVNLEAMLYDVIMRYRNSHPGEPEPLIFATSAFVEASLALERNKKMPQGYVFGWRVIVLAGRSVGVAALNQKF